MEIFFNENLSDRSRHIQKAPINYFTRLNKESMSPNVFTKVTPLRQFFKMTSVARSSLFCDVTQHDLGLWGRAAVPKCL